MKIRVVAVMGDSDNIQVSAPPLIEVEIDSDPCMQSKQWGPTFFSADGECPFCAGEVTIYGRDYPGDYHQQGEVDMKSPEDACEHYHDYNYSAGVMLFRGKALRIYGPRDDSGFYGQLEFGDGDPLTRKEGG